MRKVILALVFIIFIVIGCDNTITIGQNNKFMTEYRVYYAMGSHFDYEVYTDSEVICCSFNGTNYLLEKGQGEEIFSSTAPIRILKRYKFDSNGNKSEYTGTN